MGELKNKNAFLGFISFAVPFVLILASGGSMLRSGVLIFCFYAALIVLFFYCRLSSQSMLIIVSFYFFVTFSGVISCCQNIPFTTILTYNFGFYCFPIFYILARRKILFIDAYFYAILFFSILIIALFFGMLFNISFLVRIHDYLVNTFKGLYGDKSFESTDSVLSITYFQGTLAIVPGCIFFLHRKKYFSFAICALALGLSGSRFSLLLILFFICFFNFKKLFEILLLLAIIISVGVFFKVSVILDIQNIFKISSGSGMSIRMGHLRGIIELLTNHPMFLITGQGPGTSFYSYGFNSFTNSVEVSQFDFIRKYGLFFFSLFSFVIFWTVFSLLKNNDALGKGIAWGLVAHYLISFSNPVLTSLPFFCFLAIAIVYNENYIKIERMSK